MRILISCHISVGRICSLISPTLRLVCWSCRLNSLCLFKSRERSFSMVLAVPWICRLQEPCYGLHLRTTILASLQPNPLSNCRLQPFQISGYLLSLWLIQIITICKASKFARIIQYRPRALQAVLIRAEHILLIVRQQKPIHKELFHPSPCSDWIISLPLSVPLQLVPLVSDHLHHFWFRSLHHPKKLSTSKIQSMHSSMCILLSPDHFPRGIYPTITVNRVYSFVLCHWARRILALIPLDVAE